MNFDGKIGSMVAGDEFDRDHERRDDGDDWDGGDGVGWDGRLWYRKLVGGLDHFLFSHILGTIIPIDEIIFFRGVAKNHQPDSLWHSSAFLDVPGCSACAECAHRAAAGALSGEVCL